MRPEPAPAPPPLTVWSAVPSTILIRGSPLVWLSAAPRRAVRSRRAPARWPGGNSMRLRVMSCAGQLRPEWTWKPSAERAAPVLADSPPISVPL